ncbi:unnamed protein product [Dicrocoelium dendriticum]|nr:unnamed protein product [Dicrocoelium dendriticum]
MGKRTAYNYSRNAHKRRQKEKARLKIKNPVIDSAWKHGLSIKSNFDQMGIAYDPNEVLKISNRGFFQGTGCTSVPRIRKKTKVIQALENAAANSKSRPLFMSEDDRLFCIYNLEQYGENYKEMARDARNLYQLTPNQLERLIEKFKKTTHYQDYITEKRLGTFNIADLYNIAVA